MVCMLFNSVLYANVRAPCEVHGFMRANTHSRITWSYMPDHHLSSIFGYLSKKAFVFHSIRSRNTIGKSNNHRDFKRVTNRFGKEVEDMSILIQFLATTYSGGVFLFTSINLSAYNALNTLKGSQFKTDGSVINLL